MGNPNEVMVFWLRVTNLCYTSDGYHAESHMVTRNQRYKQEGETDLKVISIYTSKGGIGKSSLAEALAAWFAALGRKVGLIDTDRQANASNLINMESIPAKRYKTLTHVVRDGVPLLQAMYQVRYNLWVVPSDTNINKASNHIVIEQAPELLVDRVDELKASLSPVSLQHLPWHTRQDLNIRQFKPPTPVDSESVLHLPDYLDYLVIDHAPNPGAVGESFLRATDEIWSPLLLEQLPVQGFAQMILTINDMFKRTPDRKPTVNVVPFRVNHQRDITTTFLADLYMIYPHSTFRSVHDDQNIPLAQAEDPPRTLVEFARSSRASKEILEIALIIEKYQGTFHNNPVCDACNQIRAFAEEQLAVKRG